MVIKLRLFYDIKKDENGNLTFSPMDIHFDYEMFDKSVEDVRKYFAGESNDIEVQLFVQDDTTPKRDETDIVRCIMADIKNEESCTYKLLSSMFECEDVIEKKVAMLRYLLEKYIVGIYTYNARANMDEYYMFTYDLPYCRSFKYLMPADCVKATGRINRKALTPEMIATHIMPRYYQEIGWWDNESLRKDKEKMDFLSKCWYSETLI